MEKEMTNEEAIEHFKRNLRRIKIIMAEQDEALKDSFSQSLEATEMAIKALEQQPTKEEKALLQKWCDNRGISMKDFEDAMDALEKEPCKDMGEVSDGYHTFNQLYYQRAVLFATIVNEHPDISWKSFKHFDGHYCFDEDGEMFIVGIDTPKGSYTYHYHKKYWDLFKCKELECGKEWDGHTEKDVTRLLSLEQCEDAVSRQAVLEIAKSSKSNWIDNSVLFKRVNDLSSVTPIRPKGEWEYLVSDRNIVSVPISGKVVCKKCGHIRNRMHGDILYYCPNCGADMKGENNEND